MKAKYYYRFKLKSLSKALPLKIEVKARNLFEAECKLAKVINNVGAKGFKKAQKKMEKKLKKTPGKSINVVFKNILTYYKLISVKEI